MFTVCYSSFLLLSDTFQFFFHIDNKFIPPLILIMLPILSKKGLNYNKLYNVHHYGPSICVLQNSCIEILILNVMVLGG